MRVSCPGVRVDTWIESGTEVTPFYDSLLGKLMAHGSSREDAVKRMVAALQGTVLGGIPSNLEYLSTIVASQGFRTGTVLRVLCLLVLQSTADAECQVIWSSRTASVACMRMAAQSNGSMLASCFLLLAPEE